VIERLRRLGLHPSIVLALVLMSLWMVAYRRLDGIGEEFYEPSIAGVRAFALYLNGRYGDAARAYRQAHRGPVWANDANDPTGAYAVAVGDDALGEQRARAALAVAPEAIEPRVTLAEVALDRGDLAEASRELAAALTVQRHHVDALYLSAVVHGRTGRAGEAIDALNLALRSGKAGERRATLFRLLELAGDLEAGPAATRPLCLLAHLFRYLRIFDSAHAARALTYGVQAVAANDRPADAWLTIAVIHNKRGQHEKAMQAARHALAADPNHAEAYRWAAVEARRRGDLLLQYRMSRKAFESAPTDPFYLEDLAQVVLTGLGDPHMLAALMEQALVADPSNAEARNHLEAARRALASPQITQAAR